MGECLQASRPSGRVDIFTGGFLLAASPPSRIVVFVYSYGFVVSKDLLPVASPPLWRELFRFASF